MVRTRLITGGIRATSHQILAGARDGPLEHDDGQQFLDLLLTTGMYKTLALMLKMRDVPVDDTTSSFSGKQLGEK